MHLTYPRAKDLHYTLKGLPAESLHFIVLITAALNPHDRDALKETLTECVRVLRPGGLLFVQGRPEYLPELGVYLDRYLHFKYWIAVESILLNRGSGLPTVHAAVLLFANEPAGQVGRTDSCMRTEHSQNKRLAGHFQTENRRWDVFPHADMLGYI